MTTRRIDPDDWDTAIGETDGPQLVVAGPGTGKTEFLARRAAHLIRSGSAQASELVVLTFSRRAAGAIRSRIAALLGPDHASARGRVGSVSGVDAATFHGYAHRLLEAQQTGEVVSVLTTPEQVALVGRLLKSEHAHAWPVPFRAILASPSFAEEVADFMLRCRERLLSPEHLQKLASTRSDWRALPAFYARYDSALESEGRVDYAGLVSRAIDVMDERSDAGASSCRYVLVDEYQDTSPAQARLLENLAAEHRNLTVAGDPYQSIYSFRGADLSNIADFPRRFRAGDGSPALRWILTTSFRVPAPIMDAAVAITAGEALPGTAGHVEPAPHTGRVEVHLFDQQSAEAEWIAARVERLIVEDGMPPERVAVLVRSKRRLLAELSRALDRRRVLHDSGEERLVDEPAVRMILDLATAAAHAAQGFPDEVDRSMRRVLLGPLVRLGIAGERDLLRVRRRDRLTWSEVVRRNLPRHRRLADVLADPSWALSMVAADGMWLLWTSLEAFETIANDPNRRLDRNALAAFSQVLNRQADRDPMLTLAEYAKRADDDTFEATPLLSTRQPWVGRVVVTTLHQAKGLEFDAVFIADASEGVFPDPRRSRSLLQPAMLHPDRPDDAGSQVRFRLQEETRLAYTAMTRARSRVTWTATGAGIDEGEGRPSRFLMAVAETIGIARPGPPPDETTDPVSVLELQASLRRTANDPRQAGAQRLAAIRTLALPDPPWKPEQFAGFAPPGPDTGVVMPPVRLSPSQVESFERCPRAYVLDRRLHLDETRSVYGDFGSLMHAVLEQAETVHAPERLGGSTLDEAVVLLDELLPRVDFGSDVLRDAWRERGVELLAGMYAHWPAESRQPIALEHPLSLTIDGAEWVGVADRVELIGDGRLRLVDYKTSKTAPTIKDAASSLQLGFYVLAAATDPALSEHGRPVEAQLWYPSRIPGRWRYDFDLQNLDSITDRLRTAARAIAAEDWEPRVSKTCVRCPVRMLCDRWPEGREAYVE